MQRVSPEQNEHVSSQEELETHESTEKTGVIGEASPFKILPEQGVCSGYASTVITVWFEPTSVNESEEDLEIICTVKQKGPVRSAPDIFKVHLQAWSFSTCCVNQWLKTFLYLSVSL